VGKSEERVVGLPHSEKERSLAVCDPKVEGIAPRHRGGRFRWRRPSPAQLFLVGAHIMVVCANVSI
jgi:hypothetical protein